MDLTWQEEKFAGLRKEGRQAGPSDGIWTRGAMRKTNEERGTGDDGT